MSASKKTMSAARQENRLPHAPKKTLDSKIDRNPREMIELKKITARMLDELKNPARAPSDIILAGLIAARSVN